MAENKGFSLKTFGMPWWLAGAIAVIVIAAAATGALSADLAGCFALILEQLYRRRSGIDLPGIRIPVHLQPDSAEVCRRHDYDHG